MRRLSSRGWPLAIAAAALLLAACGGRAGLAPMPGVAISPAAAKSGKIQHVVIIVQENRSFNNLFYDYPGAKTVSYGYDSNNEKIALKPLTLATSWDLQHNARGYMLACNGKGKTPGTDCQMNGFDKEKWTCGTAGNPKCPFKYPPYAYVPHSETKPYFDMAHQYVLADNMFASDFDISSFESHQYIIAAVNPKKTYDYPDQNWGCSGAQGDGIKLLGPNRELTTNTIYPCWNVPTLADELDAAGLTWSFYAVPVTSSGDASPAGRSSRGGGIWSAYQAIKHIYNGKDWDQDVFTPPSKFLTDIGNGDLRNVTWITPTYANSDHGGNGSKTGPSWVASLVNAIGESPFWKSTAIFVFWDDEGGWYDSVSPPYVNNDGLGMRLPLLIISPYAKKGHVSHIQYEHGSILKFVEEQFGLASLAASDKRATSPASDSFDFNQSPRKFTPFRAPYDVKFFEQQPLDTRSPDTE